MIKLAATAAAALALAAGALWLIPRLGAGPGPRIGQPAPPFTVAALGGGRIEPAQLRGHPLVLNFWATWCAPCKEELPAFEQVYRQYQDQGLVVLAISIDDTATTAQIHRYVDEGNPRVGPYTFPVGRDRDQSVARLYRLTGVPETFFVDPDGVVRVIHPGVLAEPEIRSALPAILPTLLGTP